jgi:hypothetical protein
MFVFLPPPPPPVFVDVPDQSDKAELRPCRLEQRKGYVVSVQYIYKYILRSATAVERGGKGYSGD